MSLIATNKTLSSLRKRKSLPPRFKSANSATLTGVFTTDSGSYVSNSRNSLKCGFVLISGLFTIS